MLSQPKLRNLLKPSLSSIAITLMARSNPVLPEGIKIKLAVLPEEEHG
jgi:hypothetical protein